MKMEKCCSSCKELKNITHFSPRKVSKDGYNCRCKVCIYKYNKIYKKGNKAKKKAKEYNLKNQEKIKRNNKEYSLKNKEKKREYQRNYYLKNKESLKKYGKEYNLNNRNKINKRARSYIPSFNAKVAKSLHTNILAAVRRVKTKKYNSSINLTGCSIEFFIEYIEQKFTTNMNWDNYGVNGWHFDHIKPCSSFDLSDPEQQKLCFHYTNYQPLWATREIAIQYGESTDYIGNLEKGYKYNEDFSC